MLKPTSHMAIDSSKADPRRMKVLEEILYGTDKHEAQLPYPGEILDLFSNDPALGIYQEPERPDGNLIPVDSAYPLYQQPNYLSYDYYGERFTTGWRIWEATKLDSGTPPTLLRDDLTIKAGETYSLSIFVKNQQPSTTNAALIFYDVNGDKLLKSGNVFDTGGEWGRLEVTYTHPLGSPDVGAGIYFYPFRNAGERTLFTSPKLERGPVATPWPPTPYSVSGYSDIHYSTGRDLRGFKDEGIYAIHERTNLTEQGVGLYGL